MVSALRAAEEAGDSCRWPVVSTPTAAAQGTLQDRTSPHQAYDAGHWIGRMSGQLAAFKETPSKSSKASLLVALLEYQEAVSKGLQIPRTVPPPLRPAATLSDWHYRQLDEALTMYRINPSNTRLDAMQEHLQGFQDALARGKVKPW